MSLVSVYSHKKKPKSEKIKHLVFVSIQWRDGTSFVCSCAIVPSLYAPNWNMKLSNFAMWNRGKLLWNALITVARANFTFQIKLLDKNLQCEQESSTSDQWTWFLCDFKCFDILDQKHWPSFYVSIHLTHMSWKKNYSQVVC